ncbi:MAG: benzoyl-CoA reductase subunit C [Myxococcota bacterium]|nr:benzoyl-CoA reductase subunit C [Myxococcota bacterium]
MSKMSQVNALVERADALYRDADFTAVQRWKEANPGAKAVGYLPIYVPRELIHAAGMLPVGVTGHGDIEIIRGDAYFQSYICHLPRSVVELGVSGRLDSLDGILFPSICDVVRNLSGMWKVMFPDRWTKYFDVPQNFDMEVGGKFYRAELNSVRHDLEELGGKPILDDALRASIAVYNENRQKLEALYDARSRKPWKVPAWESYLMVRAGFVLPVEEHNALLDEYLALAMARDEKSKDHIRVVVTGAFCEQPPVEMIRTLERAGCYIVDDDFLLGSRWLRQDVNAEGDPIFALADAFLNHSTSAPSKYQEDGKNGEALVAIAKEKKADGIVFCAPSFCDPALLDQPMAVAAVERADIPYTSFLYSENTGQFQVIREQAGTFADSIRLWSNS